MRVINSFNATIRSLALLLWLAPAIALCATAPSMPLSPAQIYQELFEQVQMQRIYADGKTFVDALPLRAPAEILADYRRQRSSIGFDLRVFVTQNFQAPAVVVTDYQGDPSRDVRDHIDALWSVLTRQPDVATPDSSLLPLPHPYVVPGGRFREIYYWDSFFTMLGLEASGRHDLARDMLANFAHLIDVYGHVPNGNRTYYVSRSQPPFFAAIVELIAERDGDEVYRTYLPQLEREYAFWMDGAEHLQPGDAFRRVVRLQDGTLLNRYWDDRAVPRDESYAEDVATARESQRPAAGVYRELRAGAESGWDFSSRWLSDGKTLATIRTTAVLPVDLNSLLYRLEQTLATAYRVVNDEARARSLSARAGVRRAAIHRTLWDASAGSFGDYAWRERRLTGQLTAAALYPLYFGVATREQSARVAAFVRERLLQPAGLATTSVRTGQQWDAPNGWAPLQWIAVKGLRDNAEPALARDIACRWINKNIAGYQVGGRLVEKYDVSGPGSAGGGEYPTQDGFGWTNGVLRKLLTLYPASGCGAVSTDG